MTQSEMALQAEALQPEMVTHSTIPQMVSLEDARTLVLGRVRTLPLEEVGILDIVGRVAARDLASDIDVSPFAYSAMDGFALRAAQVERACADAPVHLRVKAEVPAGSCFEGDIAEGECVRIMTGAPLPAAADSVEKYEQVAVLEGDGHMDSVVALSAPVARGNNVRPAGEEAHAGDVIVRAGDIIHPAGVGFLASCGIVRAHTYARPRVALIATGSELVDATERPTQGHIRDSNSWALAACVKKAGGIPTMLSISADDFGHLRAEVVRAAREYDFVITTGGAANGDFDFIKKVVDDAGELLMTTVNMRPGKAQTFGIVEGTPVFGLPGNPAAAYLGFEMIIRPVLRKMQGYSCFERPHVWATLAKDTHKTDPRRIFTRACLSKTADGGYEVCEQGNQSSGLFGPIQRANCFMVLPEGAGDFSAGSQVECVMLDVPEEVLL